MPVLDTLPDEILGYIMVVTLQSYPDLRSQHRFPTTMLLTSRRLQRVAFRTPSLWTTLIIRPSTNLEVVASRLKRTGVLPLWIQLDGKGLGGLATHLKHVTHRLAELRFSCACSVHRLSDRHVHPDLDTLLPPGFSLPLLSLLEIHAGEYCDMFIHAPRSIPRLEYLSCRQIGTEWADWPRGILKEFHLLGDDGVMLKELLCFLAGNPHLRILHLENIPFDTTGSDNPEFTAISMAALEVLRILGMTPDESNALLSKLETPRLRTLVLGGLDEEVYDFVWSPLCKSLTELQDLLLLGWNRSIPNSHPFLKDLALLGPNVTRFRCDPPYPFSTLWPYDEHPIPFPKLRHLATWTSHLDNNLTFLHSRSAPLDQLSIHVDCLGLGPKASRHDFALHEKFLKDLRRDFNVNFYGKVGHVKRFKSWKMLQEGTCLVDSDADAPRDGFLDFQSH